MVRTAACCCGALVIEAEGDPLVHGVCHCSNCKRRTGSAFGISAYFKTGQIHRKTGVSKIYEVIGDNRQERHFCAHCGTTLFWTAESFDGLTGIAGGCFVEDTLPEPTLTLSNHGQCPWLRLPEGWSRSLERIPQA